MRVAGRFEAVDLADEGNYFAIGSSWREEFIRTLYEQTFYLSRPGWKLDEIWVHPGFLRGGRELDL